MGRPLFRAHVHPAAPLWRSYMHDITTAVVAYRISCTPMHAKPRSSHARERD